MATVAHGRKAGTPAHNVPHHHHAAPPRKKAGRGGWIAAGLAAVIAGGAGWYLIAADGDDLTPEERLVKQMQDAAAGSAPPTHVFGGELAAAYGDRGMSVVAKDVPTKACVSAAWRLAREGVVTVNGATPMRISAAILSELCSEDPKGVATIQWAPRDK